jgi:hypothetical protein
MVSVSTVFDAPEALCEAVDVGAGPLGCIDISAAPATTATTITTITMAAWTRVIAFLKVDMKFGWPKRI